VCVCACVSIEGYDTYTRDGTDRENHPQELEHEGSILSSKAPTVTWWQSLRWVSSVPVPWVHEGQGRPCQLAAASLQ